MAAALGGLLFGFDTSVINGAVNSIQKTLSLDPAVLGFTIASVIAPAYMGGMAPARLRGGPSSLQQLAITLGIFLALPSDAGMARIAGGPTRNCGGDCRPGGGGCSSAWFPPSCMESFRCTFRNLRRTSFDAVGRMRRCQ